MKKRKVVALDPGPGNGSYSKFIPKSNWQVESIDLFKKFEYSNLLNIKINTIDLEKNLKSIEEKLIYKSYDLVLIFSFYILVSLN